MTGHERWAALEVRHVAAFVAVVEEGSFTAAAARLGYTQSGISQQIAALERIVERPLVVRHAGGRRPIELTPAGEAFLAHGHALLARVDRAHGELAERERAAAETVRVAAFSSAAVRLLPQLRRELAVRTSLRVEIVESRADDVLFRSIASGETELGFVVLPVPGVFAVEELGRDRYVAVVSAGSPLAERATLPLASLVGQPLLGIQRCVHEDLVEAELAAAGVDCSAFERYEDNRLIQSLAAAGDGVAVVPSLTVDRSDDSVRVLELEPALPPRRLALAHRRDRELSPQAEELRRTAVLLCRRLLATAEPAVQAVS